MIPKNNINIPYYIATIRRLKTNLYPAQQRVTDDKGSCLSANDATVSIVE